MLASGKRSHGGQLKRYKDTLKSALKSFGINNASWENTAMDRPARHITLKKGGAQREGRETHEEKMWSINKFLLSTQPRCEMPYLRKQFRVRIVRLSHNQNVM